MRPAKIPGASSAIAAVRRGLCLLLALGPLGAGLAQAADTIGVGAVVLSKSVCKFNTAAVTLGFGALSAASEGNAVANASLTFKCKGSAPMATFVVQQNGGQHKTAQDANRMRHALLTSEYLPYSLSVSPSSATIAKKENGESETTLSIQGTILPAHFQNALAGSYADMVVLALTP